MFKSLIFSNENSFCDKTQYRPKESVIEYELLDIFVMPVTGILRHKRSDNELDNDSECVAKNKSYFL